MPLRGHVKDHIVETLREKGWPAKDNGILLDFAERDGYEILVTKDQNLGFQQGILNRRIGFTVVEIENGSE